MEHAVALSHLIFSGVLFRHPGLTLIAAHGGGYLPTHIGRADHAWRARTDAAADCAHAPSSYLRRPYFDSLAHDPHVLRELVRVAGAAGCSSARTSPSTWGPGPGRRPARGGPVRHRPPPSPRRQRRRAPHAPTAPAVQP
ncbi:amidohydrolase family protein [Streptomyces decoyicus]|uniref:amidohydrolase family protein n=1 Tax=Streptomyces decoyicus TaxID=249567 RepID=UPI00398CAC67